MKLYRFKLAVLFLCCQSLSAEPQLDSQSMQAEPEVLNKATETLNDPTVMSKKMEQRLSGVMPTPANNTNKGGLQDPTQMNQNFREALQGRSTPTAAPAPGIVAPSLELPDMRLLASVCGMHKEKNHVMLQINGKTEMVGIGDTITTIKGAQIFEIQVIEVEGKHVKVVVQPANITVILR